MQTPPSRRQGLEQRLKAIESERTELLRQLAEEPADYWIDPLPASLLGIPACVAPPSTSDERITLFTRLFRSRDDVFPKRWENKNKSTHGYSPACRNEWVQGVCEKPKTKCTQCSQRVFLRLDETVIRGHLEGLFTIGTYAIRLDDTCTFLAADFDKERWRQDVMAFKNTAIGFGIETYIERSRSGNGAHAWMFFKEPVPARLARQLGTIILMQAIEKEYQQEFNSYDRFFPSQDTLPKGGFGNLIALPLQRIPRKDGNSVFVDDDFNPWPDQWNFLSKVRLLSKSELIHCIEKNLPEKPHAMPPESPDLEILQAEKLLSSGKTLPVHYAGAILITVSNCIEIPIDGLPSKLITMYKRAATFANPKFYELQRLRFSTWKTPRYICCAELSDDGKRILLPRGLLSPCMQLSESAGASIEIADLRPQYRRISVKFTGELLAAQTSAVRDLLKNESGILVAPPGAGKTVIGCALIGKRKLPTLILVHRKQLADQWKQRLLQFTNLTKKQIGTFDLKDEKRKGVVDIGMFQTLAHAVANQELIREYGMVIVDECHRVPAPSFEPVLKKILARHYVGLTATPYRKDGLDKIITMQCGPILHTMAESAAQQELVRNVVVRETSFKMTEGENIRSELHEIWQALITDPVRVALIAADIISALSEGRFPLVLSDRKEHLEAITKKVAELQENKAINGFVITSDNGKKERDSFIKSARDLIAQGKPAFLLSTGSLIGEGFDLPELCTLILAMPLSFKGRLVQYAGRLHRESSGKKEVRIYDYVDVNLGLGITMFRKRLTTYRKMGYTVHLPANSRL